MHMRNGKKNKKGFTFPRAKLIPTMNKILVAKRSENYPKLNRAFPSIFKSYLDKSFGSYKRIIKDNILKFKKLLLKEHPILIKKAKEDKAMIKQIKLEVIEKEKVADAEEVERIKKWKIAYPGILKKYSFSKWTST